VEAALRQGPMLPPRLAHLVSENSSAVLELFDDSNATRAPGLFEDWPPILCNIDGSKAANPC